MHYEWNAPIYRNNVCELHVYHFPQGTWPRVHQVHWISCSKKSHMQSATIELLEAHVHGMTSLPHVDIFLFPHLKK